MPQPSRPRQFTNPCRTARSGDSSRTQCRRYPVRTAHRRISRASRTAAAGRLRLVPCTSPEFLLPTDFRSSVVRIYTRQAELSTAQFPISRPRQVCQDNHLVLSHSNIILAQIAVKSHSQKRRPHHRTHRAHLRLRDHLSTCTRRSGMRHGSDVAGPSSTRPGERVRPAGRTITSSSRTSR